jgi:membrane dipeptidase
VALGEDLNGINDFHARGVRLLGLVHVGNNSFTASSRPNPAFGDDPDPTKGLTDLGFAAIERLNDLGIVPDVSQLTPLGVSQVLKASRSPVIASHSGVRGRIDSPRNLTNEELRAIADKGGVVHIVAFANYVRDNTGIEDAFVNEVFTPFGLQPGKQNPREVLSAEDFARFQTGYRRFSYRRSTFASVIDWLDAVDYAVRLIGIDHVGLSSDFNNGGGVTGYAHVGEAGNVTRELLRRGYSEGDIEKLWGGNFMRVLKANEAGAKVTA